jgi:predicted methyltransferase
MNDMDPMLPPRPTALARSILASCILQGEWVIDATAGNGYDTVFLAECVGATGKVLAFDVQDAAIQSARAKALECGVAEQVTFFHESHGNMEKYAAPGTVSAVMFNLGYLPGNDHDLTTEKECTLAALRSAAHLMRPGAVLSVICYPGHPAGKIEAIAVEDQLASMSADGWRTVKYGAIGTRRPAPFLLLAVKPARITR